MTDSGFPMMSDDESNRDGADAAHSNPGVCGRGEPSDEPRGGVASVLDALAPLIEQMDHFAGFAVKFADARGLMDDVDRSTVEVRVNITERSPRVFQMARGMLQGHGFTVEKTYRGGHSTAWVVLTVPVTEDGEPREADPDRERTSAGTDSEQGSL